MINLCKLSQILTFLGQHGHYFQYDAESESDSHKKHGKWLSFSDKYLGHVASSRAIYTNIQWSSVHEMGEPGEA